MHSGNDRIEKLIDFEAGEDFVGLNVREEATGLESVAVVFSDHSCYLGAM